MTLRNLLKRISLFLFWPDAKPVGIGGWWQVYCPECHEWFRDRRHGYVDWTWTGLYFKCPTCGVYLTAPEGEEDDFLNR